MSEAAAALAHLIRIAPTVLGVILAGTVALVCPARVPAVAVAVVLLNTMCVIKMGIR